MHHLQQDGLHIILQPFDPTTLLNETKMGAGGREPTYINSSSFNRFPDFFQICLKCSSCITLNIFLNPGVSKFTTGDCTLTDISTVCPSTISYYDWSMTIYAEYGNAARSLYYVAGITQLLSRIRPCAIIYTTGLWNVQEIDSFRKGEELLEN